MFHKETILRLFVNAKTSWEQYSFVFVICPVCCFCRMWVGWENTIDQDHNNGFEYRCKVVVGVVVILFESYQRHTWMMEVSNNKRKRPVTTFAFLEVEPVVNHFNNSGRLWCFSLFPFAFFSSPPNNASIYASIQSTTLFHTFFLIHEGICNNFHLDLFIFTIPCLVWQNCGGKLGVGKSMLKWWILPATHRVQQRLRIYALVG